MKKRALSLLLAVLMFVTILPMASAAEMTFKDVPKSEWYYNSVKKAVEMDLINGKPGNVFEPEEKLTYAEAVKLAAAMHQKNENGIVTLVNGNPWYQSYVDYCKTNSIISKDYDWNKPATRAGYMEIFAKALPDTALSPINTIPDGAIPDVPMSHPQALAIYKLYRAGVLNGSDSAHSCKPADNIRRCEVAAILVRMMDASERIAFSMEAPTNAELTAVLPNEVSAIGGNTVKIDASVSGGKAPYACKWMYSLDGNNWTNGTAGTGVTSYTYTTATTPAVQYVRLVVTDAAYKSTTSNTCTVKVSASAALTVTTDKIGTANAAVGTPFTLKATAAGGVSPYTYAWESSIDGGASWAELAGFPTDTLTQNYTTTGTVLVRAKVTDNAGTVAYSAAVTVVIGSISVAVEPNVAGTVGTPVNLYCTPSGGSGTYTYLWQGSTDKASWTDVSTSGNMITVSPTATGVYYFRVTVTDAVDPNLKATSQIITLTITAAAVPLTVSIPGPLSMVAGNTINIPATVSGGTPPYSYQWMVKKSSESSYEKIGITTQTYSPAFSYASAWNVYCEVTDNAGKTATSNISTVTVTAATPLSAVAVITTSSTASPGGSVGLKVTVTGGTPPYSYRWVHNSTGSGFSYAGDSYGTVNSDSLNYTIPSTTTHFGSRPIYCEVKDSTGKTVNSNTVYITVNAAETTLSATMTPAEKSNIPSGTSTTFTVNATGGNGSYSYSWDYSYGGSWSGSGSSKTFSLTPTGSTVYVRCKITSGSQTYTITQTYYVKASTPVSATITPASPINAQPGVPVTLTVNPSGGSGSYTYQWKIGGFAQSGETKKTFTLTRNAGEYQIYCVVTDAANSSNYVSVPAAVIVKAASPLSLSVSAPSSVTAGKSATVSASISGGTAPYTVKWYYRKSTDGYWGSVQSTNTTNGSATYSPSFPSSGTWYVLCDVYDKNNTNVYKSVQIIVNTPPAMSITGSVSGSKATGVTAKVNVSGGSGSFTYQWSWWSGAAMDSWKAITSGYAVHGYFTNTLTIDKYYIECDYHLRCKVTDTITGEVKEYQVQ